MQNFNVRRLVGNILAVVVLVSVVFAVLVRFNGDYSPFLIRHFPIKGFDRADENFLLVQMQPMLPVEAAGVFKSKGWRPATQQELQAYDAKDKMVATPILSNCEWVENYKIQDCAALIKTGHGEVFPRSRLGFDWGDSSIRWLAVEEKKETR